MNEKFDQRCQTCEQWWTETKRLHGHILKLIYISCIIIILANHGERSMIIKLPTYILAGDTGIFIR